MKTIALIMAIALTGTSAYAAVTVEGEAADTLGSKFTTGFEGTASGGAYVVRSSGTEGGSSPGNTPASYTVNQLAPGTHDLWVRVKHGGGGSSDSFFVGNGFGDKNNSSGAEWIEVNKLEDDASSSEYRWINLRTRNAGAGENAPVYTGTGAPMTLEVGARETSTRIDALAFSSTQNRVTNGGFVIGDGGWTFNNGNANMLNGTTRDTDGDDHYLHIGAGDTYNSTIYQQVGVIAGIDHFFSFDFRVNGAAHDLKIDLFDGAVDGGDTGTNPIGSGDLLGMGLSPTTSYVERGFLISPLQDTVTIRFSNIGGSGVNRDLWVDQVRLVESMPYLPEPSSLALLGLAAVMVVWGRRHAG